jgi:hypothetical protein
MQVNDSVKFSREFLNNMHTPPDDDFWEMVGTVILFQKIDGQSKIVKVRWQSGIESNINERYLEVVSDEPSLVACAHS